MKFVFIGTSTPKEETPEHKRIIEMCTKYEHSVTPYYKIDPEKDLRSRIAIIAETIKKSDAVICDVTDMTIETSRIISLALQFHIPTLFLYRFEEKYLQAFEMSRFLTKKRYTEETLEEKLKEYFRQIDKQRLLYRFNLMLSNELGGYILEKSKSMRISKADYIRKLILKDMQENA